ncbi:MAG: ATP-binding protein [Tannerella sp.]|jgi:hypothetical protein|nr:ATP-binding protein [Tannerella sp.]
MQNNLLEHIEEIVELSDKHGLKDELFVEASEHIRFVAQKLNLSDRQALLFAHFIDNCNDRCIRTQDIAQAMKCRNIRILQYMSDIDELEKRKLIRCSRDEDNTSYRVPPAVIEAVKQNKNYFPPNHENLSALDFFSVVEDFFEQRNNNELTFDALVDELDTLIEENRDLHFSKNIRRYHLSNRNRVLAIFFCHRSVNEEDDETTFYDFDNIFEKSTFRYLKNELKQQENDLQNQKIIEHTNANGFGDRECFKLTDQARKKLLSDLEEKEKQGKSKKDLILCRSIAEKQLYYNEKESAQIQELASLLHVDNFKTIQKRLSTNGLRTGFACLFYGAPGTGKTETVYQLARQTGRDIMLVDIAETKSCWFGESEKRIKEVFDNYRNYVQTNAVAPILLFNEADAVIGKRKDSASGSVAQTENAIQNIILQEMENLDGILIATTNLTQNLDKAFERRFLYKIQFEKPNLTAKQFIWKTMIPMLSDEDAQILASQFDFSGGQIENIARKRTIDNIISGINPSIDLLMSYCQNELLDNKSNKRRIGYCA